MANNFDFVVVGAGPAGCLLASKLAASPLRPAVALVEAGPDAIDIPLAAKRFQVLGENPQLDYAYKTTKQPSLGGREMVLSRGKGLGGSTLLNFQVWQLGARDEFEEWAGLVGDDDWKFDRVMKRLKQLEKYDDQVEPEWKSFNNPSPNTHGNSGEIGVNIGPVEDESQWLIKAGVELGHKQSMDLNNGDLIGWSFIASSSQDSKRVTGASAFLAKSQRPENLTIFTETRIVKIDFEGSRAIAVVKEDGTKIRAAKEIIICAGAIDSPRLLQLSGIGPQKDLEALGIPVVKDLQHVGRNLSDHYASFLSFATTREYSNHADVERNFTQAAAQYAKDKTGPLKTYQTAIPCGYLQDTIGFESPEFKSLPSQTRELLVKETVPSYEIISGPIVPPDYICPEDQSYCTLFIVPTRPQSTGSVKLGSADPNEAPLIDPKYLSSPYDIVVLRNAIREGLSLWKTKTLQPFYVNDILVPPSDSSEDIDSYIKTVGGTLWHPSCTVRMGKSDQDSCVDKNFKVHGLEGLRVADASVFPFLPSGHTQVPAYLVGQVAFEKLQSEYKL
ncbi:hypothetical protein NQ176_g9286 [Zarea fungicola]|uniref:Uncharacterized protein n=1 Tax=Zarea fungicola TaxID=93591 RepID=A0ACC1MNH4_9HYPO|nr:hypothetical protein NQ176_g9286 [Lecanicillium fungicola]